MHDQPTHDESDLLDPDHLAEVVLGMLIDDAPGLQTVDELIRRFAGFSGDLTGARVSISDALSDLAGHGLVHRMDRFVLASQAGRRGYALPR